MCIYEIGVMYGKSTWNKVMQKRKRKGLSFGIWVDINYYEWFQKRNRKKNIIYYIQSNLGKVSGSKKSQGMNGKTGVNGGVKILVFNLFCALTTFQGAGSQHVPDFFLLLLFLILFFWLIHQSHCLQMSCASTLCPSWWAWRVPLAAPVTRKCRLSPISCQCTVTFRWRLQTTCGARTHRTADPSTPSGRSCRAPCLRWFWVKETFLAPPAPLPAFSLMPRTSPPGSGHHHLSKHGVRGRRVLGMIKATLPICILTRQGLAS